MSHKKISVVVLGNEDALKKALITILLGQDVFTVPKTILLKKYPKYENDKYEVIYTPDEKKASKDLKGLYATQHTDMSLLVVEDRFLIYKVWNQIEKLKETTGKRTEEFTVVLPLSYKSTDEYPFKCCTLDELFKELRRLAEAEDEAGTKRPHDHYPGSHKGRSQSPSTAPMEMTGGRDSKELVSEPKKCLKRKFTDPKVNLVLLGMAGTGKSASGNTILGKRHFLSKPSSNAVTTECQEAYTEIDGIPVRIIDTPDIFDDEIQPSVQERHVRKCNELCQQKPCVYLLVIHISRFTDGERNILTKLTNAFGYRAHDQTVILFTRGADLQQERMSFDHFLHSCQPALKHLIEACGDRCVLFENNKSDKNQVKKLMQTVVDVVPKEQQKKKPTGYWFK